MDILPAIDLREGKVVRLAQGDYNRQTTYRDDPVAVARLFVQAGAKWIHMVDLDGARTGTPSNSAAVRAVAEAVDGVEHATERALDSASGSSGSPLRMPGVDVTCQKFLAQERVARALGNELGDLGALQD